MFWLISTALAGWQVSESSFKVSEHDLWTSDQPNIVVDQKGNVWVGFATRYDDERYHTGGIAMLDKNGEWQLTKDFFSSARQAHVAHSPNGVVVFGSTLIQIAELPSVWVENPKLESVIGEVHFAISNTQVWGIKDKNWAYFEYDGENWTSRRTKYFNDNSVHENAITAEGFIIRTQNENGWVGYHWIKNNTEEVLVFETSDSYDVYASSSSDGFTLLTQKDIGGGNSAFQPVVLWEQTQEGFSETTIAQLQFQPPACKLEEMSCTTDAVKTRAIGLIHPEWPVLFEYQLQAIWTRECVERGEAPPFLGHEYQPPPPCLKYGNWNSSPGYGKVLNTQLRIGKEVVPLKNLPTNDNIGYTHTKDEAHLVWYEKRSEGTWVNHVRATWIP